MSFTNPQCAVCVGRAKEQVGYWVPGMIPGIKKYWIEQCDGSCHRVVERTLVDMDIGTHYDKEREIYKMERDSFDYHTGGKPT